VNDSRPLTKFFVGSALFFAWVTVQGAIQAQKPVHEFLEQGPAGIIVGAHTHIGTLGWVSLGLMGALYYLVPLTSGRPLSWQGMIGWVFWLSAITIDLMAALMIIAGIAGGQAFEAGTRGADLDAVTAPFMAAVGMLGIVAAVVCLAFAVQIVHTALKPLGVPASSQASAPLGARTPTT
jgi:cytochrome c oxidase cbb3-type subunit 1